jgi:hypothetical protein
MIPFVLQCLALICLIFASFNLFPPTQGRPVWGWLGMTLWLLSLMITYIGLHPIHGT